MSDNKYMARAKQMRKHIYNITKDFTDEQALDNKELYPDWNGNGVNVKTGYIVLYGDKLYKVLQPHTTQMDWTPDVAVSLYVEISLKKYEPWHQPAGAHDAYNKGDTCSYNGKNWVSNVDGNIYAPGVVPGQWTEIT